VSTSCSAITAAQRRTWSSLSLLREPIGWRRAGAQPEGIPPAAQILARELGSNPVPNL
jgi:hypothetical protein